MIIENILLLFTAVLFVGVVSSIANSEITQCETNETVLDDMVLCRTSSYVIVGHEDGTIEKLRNF